MAGTLTTILLHDHGVIWDPTKFISRPIWSVCEHGRTRNWHYIIMVCSIYKLLFCLWVF